jgi:hypothetical protein
MTLPFLEQQFHDIEWQPHRSRQGDFVGRSRAAARLADSQRRALSDRHYVRYRRIAIEDRERLTTLHTAQIAAQAGLEFRDPNLFHDHM